MSYIHVVLYCVSYTIHPDTLKCMYVCIYTYIYRKLIRLYRKASYLDELLFYTLDLKHAPTTQASGIVIIFIVCGHHVACLFSSDIK